MWLIRSRMRSAALRMTSDDLLEMKLIDGIVPEPPGGAHLDPEAAFQALRHTLKSALDELSSLSTEQIIEERYQKFRNMGNFFSEVAV